MSDRVVSYTFRGSFTNLTAGLTTAGRNVEALGAKMTALDKNGSKMRAGLTRLGNTAGTIGLVAAAGLGAVILKAASFDKAMSSVQAATHETAGNMELLRAAAIKAGADTAYSASEAASAIEELAKAGVSTQDILAGGLSGSLNLAAAGALDVGQAAEIAATAMTQFKLGGDQVGHVADLLSAGAGKAQGSVEDLGMALKQSGLVASQTGLSIEETVGTLSAFASAGLIGSDAGTSFKTMLQALTPNSKAAKEELERLGVSAYDAQGNFVGMANFAGQLRESLSTLSTEQQNAALKVIFGSDAVRAASVIYQQGADGIQGWIDKTNDAGYAAETASTRMDNLAGDWEQFTGSLETALIGAGDGSQGPLRSLVQGATDVVNAFNKLPGPVKNAGVALAGITAVTGGGLWFGAKVVSGIAETKQALDQLGLSAGKTGKALSFVGKGAGIAAAALGGLLVIDQIQQSADKAAPGVEEMTKALLGLSATKELPDDLDNLAAGIERLADPNTAQSVQDNLSSIIGGYGNDSLHDNAVKQIEAIDQALAGLVATAGTGAAEQAFDNLASSANLSGDQINDLKDLLPNYKEALVGAENATSLAAGATEDFGTAARATSPAIEKLKTKLTEQAKAAKETAQSFITLGDSLNNPKKSLGEWLHELEKQAQALRDFTKNAQTAARKGLDEGLIKSLNEAGPAGALRMKQLANATDAEIGRANKAWRAGQAAIREYVNMRVPDKKIVVDGSQAQGQIKAVRDAIATLHDKHISITVQSTQTRIIKQIGIAQGKPSADGGSVPKTGLPYGDRHPYLLADGEEVISNRHGQADRHRPLLKAINAGRLADGGTAGGVVGGDAGGRSTKELQKALDKLTKSLDADRAQREELVRRRNELRSSVKDGLRSDIFATSDAWSSGGSPIGALRGDIRSGQHFVSLIKELRRKGVSGAALQEIIASGDVQRAELMASMSRSGLGTYERLYDRRERVLSRAGSTASTALGFGRHIDRVTDKIEELRGEVQRLQGVIKAKEKADDKSRKEAAKETADGVNGAAQHGHRRGSR